MKDIVCGMPRLICQPTMQRGGICILRHASVSKMTYSTTHRQPEPCKGQQINVSEYIY